MQHALTCMLPCANTIGACVLLLWPECCGEPAAWVRQEPLGVVEKRLENGGPDTGPRRRPSFVDRNGAARPRLHHEETPEALQQEVAQRKGGC